MSREEELKKEGPFSLSLDGRGLRRELSRTFGVRVNKALGDDQRRRTKEGRLGKTVYH
jgi:hypothetical protein